MRCTDFVRVAVATTAVATLAACGPSSATASAKAMVSVTSSSSSSTPAPSTSPTSDPTSASPTVSESPTMAAPAAAPGESQLREAAVKYQTAIGKGDYATACTLMSSRMRDASLETAKNMQQQNPSVDQTPATDCASAVKVQFSQVTLDGSAVNQVRQARIKVDGDKGYIYVNGYALTYVVEDGEWKADQG